MCCQACELRWAVVVGNCFDLAAKLGLVSACDLLLLDAEHCMNGKVEETEVCVSHLYDNGPHLFFPCIWAVGLGPSDVLGNGFCEGMRPVFAHLMRAPCLRMLDKHLFEGPDDDLGGLFAVGGRHDRESRDCDRLPALALTLLLRSTRKSD